MATHLGLGHGIRVLKQEITRGALEKWRKEVLVDTLMSLALSTGAIPGLQQHLEAAHKVAVASPANGGGVQAAMSFLKSVGTYVVPTTGEDSATLGNDDPDCSQGSGSAAAASQQPPPTGPSTSQPLVKGGDSNNGPGLCRSNWKGIRCADGACIKIHKDYCLLQACYPIRNASCSLWHPRSWTAPNVQGNGRKGNGQPSNKAASSNTKSRQHKETILSRENKLLKQEVALYKERSRLEARKQMQSPRISSYRDAVTSGLSRAPPPQQPRIAMPCTQPLVPEALQEAQMPGTSSASVLPVSILAAIQLAVEKALQSRNPH